MTMSCWNRFGLKAHRGRVSLSMRILITGGFGFVGGRLAVHLAQAGHQIVLGSRNAIGPPAWLPQAEVAQTNWDEAAALERCCKGVDVVIQAAGMNAQDCAADPVAALAFNGVATARLVAAAIRASVHRIIYLSTAHVYASPLVGTITEETCPRNLHPYATSHLAGENAVLSAGQRGHIQGIVLRLSNAFGAPMYKDVNCWMLLVNDLCRQAVSSGKLVLHSDGLQQRDFITLHDAATCVSHFIDLPLSECSDGVFNLGGEWARSVYELTQLVAARCQIVLGFMPAIERISPLPEEHTISLTYRITKLKSTGFSLHSRFEEEIDSIISFCQMELMKH